MKNLLKSAIGLVSLLILGLRLSGCSDTAFVESRGESSGSEARGVKGPGTDGSGQDGTTGDDALPDEIDDLPSSSSDGDDGLTDGGQLEPERPLTETEIKERCLANETITRTVRIAFPNPQQRCAWSQDGNLAAKNGVVTARHEAHSELQIAGGEVICGMEFNFAQQEMRYDDEISLLFNGRFLMHSVENDMRYFQQNDGFYQYDWSRYVGKPYSANYSNINDYCVGSDTGQGTCSMPPTETNGMIRLEFADEITFKLSALADKERKGVFSWITSGDNDAASDCQHMDIEFDVVLTTTKK